MAGTGNGNKSEVSMDNLTLEKLAEMEADERMRDSRLNDLLRLLEHNDPEIREGVTRELVRRGAGSEGVKHEVRVALKANDPEVRLRARFILVQIERDEKQGHAAEINGFTREEEALDNEGQRHIDEAESCKEEAAQYELEIADWKRARNEAQEILAHARAAAARREAGEEIRQARRARRDAMDAYFDAFDATEDALAEAREERQKRTAERQQRRLARHFQDVGRDPLEPAPQTAVIKAAVIKDVPIAIPPRKETPAVAEAPPVAKAKVKSEAPKAVPKTEAPKAVVVPKVTEKPAPPSPSPPEDEEEPAEDSAEQFTGPASD